MVQHLYEVTDAGRREVARLSTTGLLLPNMPPIEARSEAANDVAPADVTLGLTPLGLAAEPPAPVFVTSSTTTLGGPSLRRPGRTLAESVTSACLASPASLAIEEVPRGDAGSARPFAEAGEVAAACACVAELSSSPNVSEPSSRAVPCSRRAAATAARQKTGRTSE